MDGVVTEVAAAAGEIATEQSLLLSVAEIDPLRVEAFVPPDYFGRLAIGQAYEVAQAAPLGERYAATVTAIDQVFDAASGTFGIELEIGNPSGTIPAGIRCAVDLDAATPG